MVLGGTEKRAGGEREGERESGREENGTARRESGTERERENGTEEERSGGKQPAAYCLKGGEEKVSLHDIATIYVPASKQTSSRRSDELRHQETVYVYPRNWLAD